MKKLLIVVDYQNDFVNGSLAFPAAKALEEVICIKAEAYLANVDPSFIRWTRTGGSISPYGRASVSQWRTVCAEHRDG